MKFSQPIAIVGIGGIFPGAHDLDTFWDNIAKGKSVSREVPEGRWVLSAKDAHSASGVHPDKADSSRACFIDSFSVSDSLDLEMDPAFIDKLDPLCHVTLFAGVNAFNNAVTEGLDRSRTGVIIGNIALPTQKSSALSWQVLGKSFEESVLKGKTISEFKEVDPLNRYVTGLPAGILAKALGLRGGTYTLDAACSSSLYAIKLACYELLSGRADAMLSGGVSMADSLYTQMGFSKLTALSPDGVCSPFDSKANGLVVGEGAGIFVLKRLDDAIQAGDNIYAIIRGIGLSNDRAGKLLAPSSEGQLRAMQAAYEQVGWSPQDIDIIECHGTGTPVGDAVEVKSLKTLWGEKGWEQGQCVIGSVKSNVGHLLTGAGAAGLMKIILALKEKTLPPTANFSSPEPNANLPGSAFQVLSNAKPWEKRDKDNSRKAAVSGFGFGGTNAHLLLEEWDNKKYTPSPQPKTDTPIAIVGMDAHFGPWESLRSFKERVIFGKHGVGPKMKKNWFGIEETEWFKKKYANTHFKGYGIDEIKIPFGKFRIPPNEFEEMFSQQVLMLKTAERALADAGHDKDDHINSGCFIGIGLDLSSTNFHVRWAMLNKVKSWAKELSLDLSEEETEEWLSSLRDSFFPALVPNRVTGNLGSITASRVGREFHFGGPTHTISSEESSGMQALEAAVRSLQHKDIDLALVGAVDLAGDLRSLMGSPYAADEGFVFGEGASAVVLKRLDDAEKDNNKIFAVIKGIGTAIGGKPDSVVPSTEAYATALERAYKDAAIDPKSISLVEMHGSSHPDEDAMESQALSDFFKHSCVMGSAKSKIGHTGAAGGLASIVKTALCLHNEVLPEKPQYWIRNRAEGPRRAGVSSFSVDGNCTHVVLEAYEKDISQRGAQLNEAVFAVLGEDTDSLLKGLDDLRSLARNSPDRTSNHLARAWHQANPESTEGKLAVAIVSKDRDELLKQLDQAKKSLRDSPNKSLDGNERNLFPDLSQDCIFYSANPSGKKEKIAFVFPGSGNNYAGMGRQLSLCWPDVLRQQDLENKYLRKQVMPEHFWNCDSLEHIKDNLRAHIFGHVTYGTIMSDILQSFKLKPDAVVSYSLGESTSLLSMRVWKERDFMMKRMGDSSLFTDELAGPFNAVKKAWKL
ncbi:type I polyketide synthase, partial [Candidatus Woesearchaeota archaeon]|nr:type I polyketide synthase [Candidatus Woesearchaeota archaeon]